MPILAGGGDPPPSGPVLGSGDRALLVRSATGFRHLDPVDQLTMEFAASYRHYCACLMRTIAVGKANATQRAMFEVTREAIAAMTEAARPGRPLGEIDDAHRRVYDAAGFGHARMAACGYSLGALYRPTWMDVPPMLYSGNPMPAAPGMVLFLHAILIDAARNLAMSLGHTIVVTPAGAEVLSRIEPAYIVTGGAGSRPRGQATRKSYADKDVRAHDVQELLDVDVLVERAHAVRERAVHAGLDVAIAP